jgi:hypothetical protein
MTPKMEWIARKNGSGQEEKEKVIGDKFYFNQFLA